MFLLAGLKVHSQHLHHYLLVHFLNLITQIVTRLLFFIHKNLRDSLIPVHFEHDLLRPIELNDRLESGDNKAQYLVDAPELLFEVFTVVQLEQKGLQHQLLGTLLDDLGSDFLESSEREQPVFEIGVYAAFLF